MRMTLDVEKLLPFDCLNVNEFGVMHMDIHSDAHEYSYECSKINRSYCLNFNEKKTHIISVLYINLLLNLLVIDYSVRKQWRP